MTVTSSGQDEDMTPSTIEELEHVVSELQARDEAWRKLAQHLYATSGEAPRYGARGLWVELFDDEVVDAEDED